MRAFEDKPITSINVFFVEPEDQGRLVERLGQVTGAFVRNVPGFMGSTLHRSLDGKKVAMVAQWASEAAYRAMRDNPASSAQLKEVLAYAMFEPGTYEVVEAFAPQKAATTATREQAAA